MSPVYRGVNIGLKRLNSLLKVIQAAYDTFAHDVDKHHPIEIMSHIHNSKCSNSHIKKVRER